MFNTLEFIADKLGGYPLIAIVLLTGVYLTIRSGGFQFRHLGTILKSLMKKQKVSTEGKKEAITPFQAVCIAVGGSVGVANISGVGTAIATGGPGALFWMWIAALLGMIIKMTEVSLAVYYRKTNPDGSHVGGPTYYMERALGEERGFKAWGIIAVIFGLALYANHFLSMQNYTVAEAIGTTFDIPFVIPSAVLVVCIYLVTLGGLKKVGQIASYMVPFMCLFYCGCALLIIIMNIDQLPKAIGVIFESAFTGKAAAGGATGVAVTTVMRLGFSRSVYSNEAGWGTSPMVHASAETDHPIKQGLMGAVEVFVDTLCVCTATGLVVVITGFYDSGLEGAELTLSAFESTLGSFSRIIIAVSIFLFSLTTTMGWYTYYKVLLEHALGGRGRVMEMIKKIWLTAYQICLPIPPFIVCLYTVYVGATPSQLWVIADINTLIPTFINVFVLLIISGPFFALLKDFKARYMGEGKVDPNFKLFYEDKVRAQKADKNA